MTFVVNSLKINEYQLILENSIKLYNRNGIHLMCKLYINKTHFKFGVNMFLSLNSTKNWN